MQGYDRLKPTGPAHTAEIQRNQDVRVAANYVTNLEAAFSDINALAHLVQDGKASSMQQEHLATMLQYHRMNMGLVQDRLVGIQSQLTDSYYPDNDVEAKLSTFESRVGFLQSLSTRLAECHMALADKICELEEHLPEAEVISRADRVKLNARQATAVANTVDKMVQENEGMGGGEYSPIIKNRLADVVTVLRAHADKLGDLLPAPGIPDQQLPLEKELTDIFITAEGRKKGFAIQEKAEALQALQAHWKNILPGMPTAQLNQKLDWLPLSSQVLSQQEICDAFVEYTAANVMGQGLPDDFPNLEVRQSRYQQSHNQLLNRDTWARERHLVTLPGGYQCISEIEPAGQGLVHHFAEGYAPGVQGLASGHRTEVQHVPNLARTELRDRDGTVLFKGLRHGVTDPFELTPKTLARMSPRDAEKLIQKASLKPNANDTEGRLTEIQARQLSNAIRGPGISKDKTAVMDEMRDHAATRMARELAVSALVSNSAKLGAALRGEVVPLTLSSLSLLTPDRIRTGQTSNERRMLARQNKAIQKLANNGQPIKLKVRDSKGTLHEVSVLVRPRTYNFGVNKGAIGRLAGLRILRPLTNTLGGWGFSARVNDTGLTDLLGPNGSRKVGGEAQQRIDSLIQEVQQTNKEILELKKLRDRNKKHFITHMTGRLQTRDGRGSVAGTLSPEEAIAAEQRAELREQRFSAEIARKSRLRDQSITQVRDLQTLSSQCKKIWRTEAYRNGGREPYKLVARLALLEHALGNTPMFNCKSGKDRSGYLDAHVKYLAASRAQRGQWPPPDEHITPEVVSSRTAFLLGTGNLEMQAKNTGLMGYKVGGVPGLKESLSKGSRPRFRGGSRHVKG